MHDREARQQAQSTISKEVHQNTQDVFLDACDRYFTV